MPEFEMHMTFGDMTLRINSETERVHGGLWLENEDGEGMRIEPKDTSFGALLLSYFRDNF